MAPVQSAEIEVLIEGLLELKSRTSGAQLGDLSILSRTVELLSSAKAASDAGEHESADAAVRAVVTAGDAHNAEVEVIAARERTLEEPGDWPLHLSRLLEFPGSSFEALAKESPVTARQLFGPSGVGRFWIGQRPNVRGASGRVALDKSAKEGA